MPHFNYSPKEAMVASSTSMIPSITMTPTHKPCWTSSRPSILVLNLLHPKLFSPTPVKHHNYIPSCLIRSMLKAYALLLSAQKAQPAPLALMHTAGEDSVRPSNPPPMTCVIPLPSSQEGFVSPLWIQRVCLVYWLAVSLPSTNAPG